MGDAVKVEGADGVTPVIEALTFGGIPVIAHLGLTPQLVNVLGGYKVQGKNAEAAKKLIEDAIKCQEAGAIALVLECGPQQLAEELTNVLTIPTIGIGAGCHTDGQVLVYHDLLGYGLGHVPKFVKKYATLSETIDIAISQYINEVKTRTFPE